MMNALLATTVLETLGCEVITVGTGNDAVNAVTNEPFDIVLMDFHMPSMNGLDATRTIRQWEADQGAANDSASQKRIPIIAITASAMPHERDACLAAGMDEVLVKPFRFDHLKSLLEQWAA